MEGNSFWCWGWACEVLEEHYSSYHKEYTVPTWNAPNSSRYFFKRQLREHLLRGSFPDIPSRYSFLLPAPIRLDPILRNHQASSTIGTLHSESESKKLGYFHIPTDQHGKKSENGWVYLSQAFPHSLGSSSKQVSVVGMLTYSIPVSRPGLRKENCLVCGWARSSGLFAAYISPHPLSFICPSHTELCALI